VPSAFEQQMIQDELQLYEDAADQGRSEDRVSRKRLERLKEGLKERLEALATRKDDLLTISEIGVDQIIVDEAQEFRKLSFATNMSTLKGIDPNGSQRAWDLYVKSRFIETKNPGRALVLASGTPITNTLGEMFSVQRLLATRAARARTARVRRLGVDLRRHDHRARAPAINGKYKPVSRFASFVNVPELIAMFRSFADVVMPEDLREYVKVPAISTGRGRSGPPSRRRLQDATSSLLDARIKAIEMREGPPEPGDDILLSVITDGRHARSTCAWSMPTMTMRRTTSSIDLVQTPSHLAGDGRQRPMSAPTASPSSCRRRADDLLRSRHDQCREDARLLGLSLDPRRADPARRAGIGDRLHAGLQEVRGQAAAVRRRPRRQGPLPDRLVRDDGHRRQRPASAQGAPPSRRALAALADRAARGPHRPPGQPARRRRHLRLRHRGLARRQMWQNNERKARFIAAALSGDTSIRRLEDLGEGQANQFAMAKAIASGDPRLMQKAGLKPISPGSSGCAPHMRTISSPSAGSSAMPSAISNMRRGGSTRSARISRGWFRPPARPSP
jgi:hypothetical protein